MKKLWQNELRNGVDLCPPKINVLKCTRHSISRRVLSIRIQDLLRQVMLCNPLQSHSVIVINCAPVTELCFIYYGLFLFFFFLDDSLSISMVPFSVLHVQVIRNLRFLTLSKYFVIADIKTIFHTQFMETLIMFLHTKFRIFRLIKYYDQTFYYSSFCIV